MGAILSNRNATGTAAKWEILPSGRTPTVGELLRLGPRAIPVGDIRGFVATTDLEADKKPAIATMTVFGVIGMLFLFGVIDIGMRARFLVAAILFGSIALSALNDILWLTTSGIYRVDVLTAGGESVRFATVDPHEHAALMAALGGIVGRNSASNAPAEALAAVELPAGAMRSRRDALSHATASPFPA